MSAHCKVRQLICSHLPFCIVPQGDQLLYMYVLPRAQYMIVSLTVIRIQLVVSLCAWRFVQVLNIFEPSANNNQIEFTLTTCMSSSTRLARMRCLNVGPIGTMYWGVQPLSLQGKTTSCPLTFFCHWLSIIFIRSWFKNSPIYSSTPVYCQRSEASLQVSLVHWWEIHYRIWS